VVTRQLDTDNVYLGIVVVTIALPGNAIEGRARGDI
jgi:hypothetical protein